MRARSRRLSGLSPSPEQESHRTMRAAFSIGSLSIGVHQPDEISPARGHITGGFPKTRAVERPVNSHRIVRQYLDILAIGLCHEAKQIVLADRIGGNVPHATQIRAGNYHVTHDARELDGRQSSVDR